jgi:hypothetical protein
MTNSKSTTVLLLVLLVATTRFLPYALASFGLTVDPTFPLYPWNFSPLMASCLAFGFLGLPNQRFAWTASLLALVVGDLGIIMFSGHPEYVLTPVSLFTYAFYAAVVSVSGSTLAGQSPGLVRPISLGIVGESAFFLFSNAACWLLGNGETYPITSLGLLECYVAGLPYFGRALVATGLFTLCIFSPRFGLLSLPQPNSAFQPKAAVTQ